MSQELFYTSAPKGLQPGSRGFCTVAATRDLAPALLEKLESLSGYRPLFPPHDARAALNPVAFAYVRVTAGGRVFPVLSRVGPAGLDYSERPNKLAHHVVPEAGELPSAGPAWLLLRPGFMETRWDGRVQTLAAGRVPPPGRAEADVCRAWQAQTGDAGWGGVPAEAFLADPGRPVYLLFEPGTDPLPLLAESLALLPAERRWEVTFSTYFTGLPQGVQCLWRCVPRDAPEAKGARQVPGALVIDLAAGLGPARGGALVAKARGQEAAPPLPGKRPAWDERNHAGTDGMPPWENPNTDDGDHFQPVTSSPAASAFLTQDSPRATLPPPPPAGFGEAGLSQVKRKPWLFGLCGAVGGTVLTLAVVGLVLIFSGLGSHFASGEVKEDPRAADVAVARVDLNRVKRLEAEGAAVKEQWEEANRKNFELQRRLVRSRRDAEDLIAELSEINAQREDTLDQAAALRGGKEKLAKTVAELEAKLHQYEQPNAPGKKVELVPYRFQLPVTDGEKDLPIPELPRDFSKLKLALRGLESSPHDEVTLTVRGGDADLTVLLKHKGEPKPVAHFSLKESRLHFEWVRVDGVKPDALAQAKRSIRNAVLEIKCPDPELKPIYVGLIFVLRNLDNPLVFRLSKEIPAAYPLEFRSDSAPLHPLRLAAVKYELVTSAVAHGGENGTLRTRWNEDIVLRVEKKLDETRLVAEWKGNHEPPPTLRVKSFVLYMVVDGLNVEVLRAGNQ